MRWSQRRLSPRAQVQPGMVEAAGDVLRAPATRAVDEDATFSTSSQCGVVEHASSATAAWGHLAPVMVLCRECGSSTSPTHQRASLGKLLAEMGAEVVRLRPGEAGLPMSKVTGGLLDWWYEGGTHRLPLDVERAADREGVRALASRAEVFIDSEPAGRLARLGLGYSRLGRRQSGVGPGLVDAVRRRRPPRPLAGERPRDGGRGRHPVGERIPRRAGDDVGTPDGQHRRLLCGHLCAGRSGPGPGQPVAARTSTCRTSRRSCRAASTC